MEPDWLADQVSLPPERWSEVISVSLIITAMNLSSTTLQRSLQPSGSWILPTNRLSDAFYSSFPCSSRWWAVFIRFLTFSIKKYKKWGEWPCLSATDTEAGGEVHSAYRATEYWEEWSFSGGYTGGLAQCTKQQAFTWVQQSIRLCLVSQNQTMQNHILVNNERRHWEKAITDPLKELQCLGQTSWED